MPRRVPKRKKLQEAKKAKTATGRKPRAVATLGHVSGGPSGLAMAILASGILRAATD